MSNYQKIKMQLKSNPKVWLITGVAGFIGSNLLEQLLKLDQTVVGLDNFATGYQRNLDEVQGLVSEAQWRRFRFIEGDIQNYEICIMAVSGIDYIGPPFFEGGPRFSGSWELISGDIYNGTYRALITIPTTAPPANMRFSTNAFSDIWGNSISADVNDALQVVNN